MAAKLAANLAAQVNRSIITYEPVHEFEVPVLLNDFRERAKKFGDEAEPVVNAVERRYEQNLERLTKAAEERMEAIYEQECEDFKTNLREELARERTEHWDRLVREMLVRRGVAATERRADRAMRCDRFDQELIQMADEQRQQLDKEIEQMLAKRESRIKAKLASDCDKIRTTVKEKQAQSLEMRKDELHRKQMAAIYINQMELDRKYAYTEWALRKQRRDEQIGLMSGIFSEELKMSMAASENDMLQHGLDECKSTKIWTRRKALAAELDD